jgi:hypothetical protein
MAGGRVAEDASGRAGVGLNIILTRPTPVKSLIAGSPSGRLTLLSVDRRSGPPYVSHRKDRIQER